VLIFPDPDTRDLSTQNLAENRIVLVLCFSHLLTQLKSIKKTLGSAHTIRLARVEIKLFPSIYDLVQRLLSCVWSLTMIETEPYWLCLVVNRRT
jgi:hypothetical protein